MNVPGTTVTQVSTAPLVEGVRSRSQYRRFRKTVRSNVSTHPAVRGFLRLNSTPVECSNPLLSTEPA